MKERIIGAFTKKKIFQFLKMVLFVVALSLILLSLLGTVAHATGLVVVAVELAGRDWKIGTVRALLHYQLCLDYQFIFE